MAKAERAPRRHAQWRDDMPMLKDEAVALGLPHILATEGAAQGIDLETLLALYKWVQKNLPTLKILASEAVILQSQITAIQSAPPATDAPSPEA